MLVVVELEALEADVERLDSEAAELEDADPGSAALTAVCIACRRDATLFSCISGTTGNSEV